jgi:serine/threonine-protein kinase RsbW
MPDVTVRIPARPEYLHVIRQAVASVAARLDFSFDGIDDLRIAVDEACSSLLSISSPATYLTVRMTPGEGSLIIVASTDASPSAWPPPGAQQTLAWQVLSALADEVAFDREDGDPALRLVKTAT